MFLSIVRMLIFHQRTELVICLFLCLVKLRAASAWQRPNIVFILADDLGWNDVSFHGSKQIPTPNLDTLAYDGILLSNYYVQPICTPTRAALLTAKYPIHTGMQHSVIVSSAPYGLGLNEKLLSEYLKELNYSTHIVGKWHLGFFADEYTPLWRGFDSHYGYYMGAEDYWTHIAGQPQWHLGFHANQYTPTYRGFDSHFGYYQGCGDYYDHTYTNNAAGDPKQWGLDFRRDMEIVYTDYGQYSTELFSSEAERIIESHDISKPLFLYLPHQAVHSGNPNTNNTLEAPWKYQQKFSYIKHPGRRMFAAMVSALDDAVGNVTKALYRRGILNNTIIVFSTDNGGPAAGFDFNFASNWPLRGLKSTLWEGGTRAAGFIWSPLLQTSGYRSTQMMHVVDWLPTLLSAAGYDMDSLPADLDGIDQWSMLSHNKTSARTEFVYNVDPREPSGAIRVQNMKLVYGRGTTATNDGWYRPEQEITSTDKGRQLTSNHVTGSYSELADGTNVSGQFLDSERPRLADVAPSHMFESDLRSILASLGRPNAKPSPDVVSCRRWQGNHSSGCDPSRKPCLFDVSQDPCEMNNIAEQNADVVEELLLRLDKHIKTMVPPRNKKPDPKGYPYYHNGVWVPWIKLNDRQP